MGRAPAPALRLHVWRRLAAFRLRIAALALVAAAGFGLTAGILSALDTLERQRAELARLGALPDLEIEFAATAEALLPRFDDLPGVAVAEARLVVPADLVLAAGGRQRVLAMAVDPLRPPRLARWLLRRGAGLDSADPTGALVSAPLADVAGLAVGDLFELRIGGRRQRLRLRGVVDSPELALAPAGSGLALLGRGSRGVVYLSSELLAAGLGDRPVDQVLLALTPSADPELLRRLALDRARGRLSGVRVRPRDEKPGAQLVHGELAAARSLLPAIALVFALTAVPAVVFLCVQWIGEQRREIGTATSLGFGWGRLTAVALQPALPLVAVALAVGVVLAWVGQTVLARAYAAAAGFPVPSSLPAAGALGRGAVVLVAVVLAAALGPALRLALLTPVRAIRGGARAAGVRLGALAGVATRVGGGLGLRYALRNLLRTPTTTAMTAAAAGAGLGLVWALLVCLGSIETAAARALADHRWNLAVHFAVPLTADEATAAVNSVAGADAEPVAAARGIAELAAGGSTRTVLVGGVPPAAGMQVSHLVAGRPLASGDREGVVIERGLADDLGLAVGSAIHLRAAAGAVAAQVVGIRESSLTRGEVYAPLVLAQRLFGLGERVNGAYASVPGDPRAVAEALRARPGVGDVVARQEVLAELYAATGGVRALLRAAAALSAPLAALLLFAASTFVILQRGGEYRTLRLLGVADRGVAAIVVYEVVALAGLAALVAVPVGAVAAAHLCARLSAAWVVIAPVYRLTDLALVLLPAVALSPVAARPALRRILSAPLAGGRTGPRFG